MKPLFSVVVPTHDRFDILVRVLQSVEKQAGAPPFEVIVADDGSTDSTPSEIPKLRFPFPFTYLPLPKGGPARARNAGVRSARGNLVAFFGDDTLLDPQCLAQHEAMHDLHGHTTAVLGRVDWAPGLRVTRFMRYINEYGLQFGYAIIPDAEHVPFNFFYTSNISLPRRLLDEAGGFDETFPFAAWEDIELAYRLQKNDQMRIVYAPRALTFHHHPTSILSFLVRQEKSGRSAAVFLEKHPEMEDFLGVPLARALPGAKPLHLRIKTRLARLMEHQPLPVPVGWYREIMEHQYLWGLKRALGGS
jgi:GT2 family glycosyltransferase